MTFIRTFISCSLLGLALILTAPGPAPAQQAESGILKPPVVAILDMRVVQRESAAGKAWQKYYDAKRKTHKDQISTEEKELRTAWEELSRQKAILAPQAFEARERAFREKEANAKRKIAGLEQELSQELRATLTEVRKIVDQKMRPILDKIVAERGIDVIVSDQDLIYFNKNYDITGEVLTQLDESLPKLDVEALAKKVKK